jgi:hypothetical protein
MRTAAHPSDLEAALAAFCAPRPAKPAAPATERPLMWSAQAQVDRLANNFGPSVEVIAVPLADRGVSYEFRKARVASKKAA